MYGGADFLKDQGMDSERLVVWLSCNCKAAGLSVVKALVRLLVVSPCSRSKNHQGPVCWSHAQISELRD